MSKTISEPTQLTVTETLNFQAIPGWLHQIAKVIHAANHRVYLVGGAVRDLIWGLVPIDWDLATDALPEEVERLFPKTIATGKSFGTITIDNREHRVEVTTLRVDLGSADGRHPAAIAFGRDIAADLGRRDFTINAMAYDLITTEFFDPFGGRADCRRRVLKTVGEPRLRFHEDGLRILRFFRFLATYELQPDRGTEQAIIPEFTAHLSKERVRDEFGKLLLGKKVATGLKGLARHGLIALFFPELLPALQFKLGHRLLWQHLLVTTETIAPVLELRLAALFHDVAKPHTYSRDAAGIHFYSHAEQSAVLCESILERLRFPKKLILKVCALIRWHMFSIAPESGQAAIRRLSTNVSPAALLELLELRRADIVATGSVNYAAWQQWTALQERFRNIAGQSEAVPCLAINGHDLNRELRINPGPLMGKIIHELNEFIIDHPEHNTRVDLLQKAAELLKSQENPMN